MACILAGKGHDLILTGRSAHTLAAAEDFRALGVSVTSVQSDLATEAVNRAVLDAARAAGQPLDVLVVNAGIAVGGKTFTEIPLEQHLDLVAINITSPVRLLHGLVPGMVSAGGGRLLLVRSLSAITPTPYEGAYGPSKSFLTSLGHGLREELVGTGVSSTILHPGAVATESHARTGMGDTRFGDNSWKNDPFWWPSKAWMTCCGAIRTGSAGAKKPRGGSASQVDAGRRQSCTTSRDGTTSIAKEQIRESHRLPGKRQCLAA